MNIFFVKQNFGEKKMKIKQKNLFCTADPSVLDVTCFYFQLHKDKSAREVTFVYLAHLRMSNFFKCKFKNRKHHQGRCNGLQRNL